jgi:outer membrane receptor protein involved in Fe transport
VSRGRSTKATAALALLAGVAPFAWARAARGDDAPPAAPRAAPVAPAAVEVTGTRAGGFVSHASEADAPREVADAASLVEPLPGVHVRRLGADDSFATLSIRGSSSTEVAVLLAGVPLTGGADPSLDLATLPLWPGAQARVYRSFAPASLGQGSLGGTLALDPPRLGARPGTDVWAAVGSFGEARVRIGDVRALGDARLVTALSASRADDDFSYYDPRLSLLERRDVYSVRANDGHAAINGLVAYAIPAGGGVTLTTTALAQARRQELPGGIDETTPFQRLDSNRELLSLELARADESGTWTARAWGRRDGLAVRDDPRRTAALGPTRTDDAIVAAGASAGRRWHVAQPLLLDLRLDGTGERFAPGTYVGAAQPPGATRASVGAGADADFRVAENWSAAASGRVDVWNDEEPTGRSFTVAAPTTVRPTGHVGADVVLGGFTLAAHGGAVARPASFVELYGDRGAFLGDPTLRPESAWTVDAGVAYAYRRGPLRVLLDTAAFATWADDLIVFVATGAYGQVKATNIGRARILGAEASVRLRAGPLEARLAWTGLATGNEVACIAYSGAFGPGAPCDRPPLPGRPANDAVGDLLYALGPVTLRYGIDAVTGLYADDAGSILVPDRVLHSAGARLDVPGVPGLRVALDLRNLFDARVAPYAATNGVAFEPIGDLYAYPLPGRSFLASVRFTERAPPSHE